MFSTQVSAAADRGLSLEEVVRVGEKVNAQVRSIGVALGAASSIDTGEPCLICLWDRWKSGWACMVKWG